MINKIIMDKVASFKNFAVLETDKKVNLVYGLNGTGKTTISNFLYKYNDEIIYRDCVIEGLSNDDEILVYNQSFINDLFYEPEGLQSIFSLSRENKEAETTIANAKKEISRIESEKITKEINLKTKKNDIASNREKVKNKVWEIKIDYAGGDRSLDFCLDNYKSSKETLFNFFIALPKPSTRPAKSINDIENEVQSFSGDNAQKHTELPKIVFTSQNLETEPLFGKQIVGNENSTVAQLIMDLNNSDWVENGLRYLPEDVLQENTVCPFCQEKTISRVFAQNIKDYFGDSYQSDINSLKTFLSDYLRAFELIPEKSTFEINPMYEQFRMEFELKYSVFLNTVSDNLRKIEDKIKSPSVAVTLGSTVKLLEDLNCVISNINMLIVEHNTKIDKKTDAFDEIKASFWATMRWDYDQIISNFITDDTESKRQVAAIEISIQNDDQAIQEQRQIIEEYQTRTINTEEAVTNIKYGLIELGISDFSIQNHHAEGFYKIVRDNEDNHIFHSLSEGEKMIISFLYFIELCKGKKDTTDVEKKKIIVIDDPISSLSHIFIFNIGRLIQNEFLISDRYEQVFVLTHSLYFFYELTDINHDRRKLTQKLFRIRKSSSGSEILEMKYEEIQNDYQSYWAIIKDDRNPPALIANCMRNIIEYFFNFVEKKDLSVFIQKKEMQNVRFQSFCRYINRESHSLGQNIFDIKEFNYDDFKDAFAELFRITKYEEHYKRMMK